MSKSRNGDILKAEGALTANPASFYTSSVKGIFEMSVSRLLRSSNFLLGASCSSQARAFPVSMARSVHYANADRDVS